MLVSRVLEVQYPERVDTETATFLINLRSRVKFSLRPDDFAFIPTGIYIDYDDSSLVEVISFLGDRYYHPKKGKELCVIVHNNRDYDILVYPGRVVGYAVEHKETLFCE